MNKDEKERAVQLEFRAQSLCWWAETDVARKCEGVVSLARQFSQEDATVDPEWLPDQAPESPGRPLKPELVSPRDVKRRSLDTQEGRAVLIHALAHIEFNAINLALDAVWRFPGMPKAYYLDWLKVAAEEARHFSLLSTHLQTLGFSYGDFSAHNGLWDMAEKTRHDLLARLALVPRTLEARGLDVTPAIRDKLLQAGDQAGAELLEVILRDEIGHVAIGNRWYRWMCDRHKVDPTSTYLQLLKHYNAPALSGPFNFAARKNAGFSDQELAELSASFD